MTDRIVEMWNEGKTSGEIAEALRISRNSVMGAVYRAQAKGLAMKKGPSLPTTAKKQKPPSERRAPSKVIKRVDNKIVVEKRIGPSVTELPKNEVQTPKNPPKKLLSLESHDCRWMVEDGYFCAAPSKSILRPWCEDHYKLVYVPVVRKKSTPFKLSSMQARMER